MRFDDNNNNNNRILLEWKDFNLPLRKFISKMYPAVVKIEMQCVWNSIPGFSFPFLRENIPHSYTLCIRRVAFPVNFSEMGREWRIWALYIIYHGFRELLLTRLFRARRSRTRIRTVFLPSFLSLASTSPHGNVSFNPSLNTRRPFDFYGRKLRALARILVFYIYIHTRVCTHNGELEGRD